jgi:hypothetical protein
VAEESETTLRSKAVDLIGTVFLLIGFAGFFVCAAVEGDSEQQVLSRTELRHPSDKRTAPIEMKGITWYVEPGFAHRYNTADDFIPAFWALAAAGGAMRERKRIWSWWRSRKAGR